MVKVAELWDRFWFQPISPSSISVFRIAFGILSLINALLYVPDFMVWFGDRGALPLESMTGYRPGVVRDALVRIGAGDSFFWGLLGLEILTSITVALGLASKPSLIALFVSRLLLYHRNPAMWHHVDILLRAWGTFLLFTPAGEMYSIDAWLRRRKDPEAQPRPFAPWGQRLIQVKLCLIYAEAFLGKIVSHTWLSGAAVYYATHFPDGARYPIPAFLDHLWIYQTLTYFTLVIEFSLMALIWNRRLRYPIIVGGVLFHLGIHAFINLDLLEFGVMIAFICFVPPKDMERLVNWLFRRKVRTAGLAVQEGGSPLLAKSGPDA